MLDQRRAATRPEDRREQLFTERYESLLAWALRLTNQNHEAAEDLVQDAFVQFMLGRTGLEQIENIDGYLRRMLRYMHASRMSRQAQRLHDTALSVADYDSLTLGWTAIEPPRRMQAFEELQQICSYACARKESSRAGSVLILRFFHDYFPTEIASVLATSRHCVDQWQRLARREVKLFMNEPGRLRFVDAKRVAERAATRSFTSSGEPMSELRQMIFLSCKGPCLTAGELREIYSSGNADALTTTKLAHIVSCRSCLDAVNSLLGLPLLAQRGQTEFSPDPPDREEPPSGSSGGGASGGGPVDVRKKLGRHLRAISEHKPQELRIAVNGCPVSSFKISSDMTEVDLNLSADEPVEFVEITSEQDVQLLFFSSGKGSESEQWAWIELSEGRTLAAFLRLNGPSLRVIYKDPLPVELSSETLNASGLSSPLALVQTADETMESKVTTRRSVDLLRSWTNRIVRALKPDEDTSLSLLSGQLDRRRIWTRPEFVAVVVVALLLAGFAIWNNRSEPALTAPILLERAGLAEQAVTQVRDHASHRLINLEERRSSEGAVVSRRRIEIWQNHATGDRAQRLYDETNKLVAGTWQKADGARVVYQHGSEAQPQAAPAAPADLLLSLDNIWLVDPSASIFRNLIAEPSAVKVERRSTSYVLTYEKERAIGASRLLKATLTLNQTDLRPIEQTLLVQRGGDLREYRFAEASFELVPSKAVDKAVFEVEPELIGGSRPTGTTGAWVRRDLTTSRVPPLTSASTPAVASAELEVDVAYLLNQAKADRNEQVALTRSAGGSLRVEGIVESEQRKNALLRALAPVSQNPAVTIDVRTVEEALRRTLTPNAISIRQAEVTANTVAVDRELRDYFSRNSSTSNGDVDEAIRSFSSRAVKRAYDALFHAIALKQLINRFGTVDMRTVAPDARAKWLAMVREQAAGFERETALLRRELQPIFFVGVESQVSEPMAIGSDGDLAVAVEKLHKLALANNDAVRSAFTISSKSSAAGLKSSFWRSSASAQGLAQRIETYGGGK
ncbi:MAG TPA: sigma-70 family RNA polymerase sigma factor [Pyrinomonadaceae bacterium]|nr:sigma-70 family RNA polymerase sigma factor [Pyrinomonadaceae bacterium]